VGDIASRISDYRNIFCEYAKRMEKHRFLNYDPQDEIWFQRPLYKEEMKRLLELSLKLMMIMMTSSLHMRSSSRFRTDAKLSK
jgi:hypothetical protein